VLFGDVSLVLINDPDWDYFRIISRVWVGSRPVDADLDGDSSKELLPYCTVNCPVVRTSE